MRFSENRFLPRSIGVMNMAGSTPATPAMSGSQIHATPIQSSEIPM
jgi:hypothetical protein